MLAFSFLLINFAHEFSRSGEETTIIDINLAFALDS